MTILFKFASRSRPEKFFKVLDSIVNNLSNKNDYHILCSFDIDDVYFKVPFIDNEFIQKVGTYKNISSYFGISKGKCDAINRDIALAQEWNVLINVSDDMPFIKYGFDDYIRSEYKNGFTGLLHTPDGLQNERLCTLAIMDRKYYEIDNFIYHSQFVSVYSDNFQTDLAKKRGMYKFVNNQIVVHEHYRAGYGVADELMQRNDSREMYEKDRITYEQLKKEYGLC